MRDPVRRVSAAAAGVALLCTILATPVFAADPAGTHSQAAEAVACATLFSVPAGNSPDPLGACQWDMRAIGATSSGSYAVNRGRGVRVGDIDTGIDLANGDIMPNVDVAASCVFLYSDTPTSLPG